MTPVQPVPPPINHPPDPRVWPIAAVMATSVFATTFVQLQGLGSLPFSHLLMKTMGLDSNTAATFMMLGTLPWSFKVIAGLFVDGVPLFGSRRRSYLCLSALTAATLWLIMGVVPVHYNLLLALVMGMNIAIVFGSATAGGLLVEAGQRFGASGRLSSLRVFAQNFGAALGLPLGGFLAGQTMAGNFPLLGTSMGAILPLAGIFASAWFLLREPPLPPRPAHGRSWVGQAVHVGKSIWAQIKNVLCRKMLMPALLLFFIQLVPTFRSTCLYEYQTKTLNYSDKAIGLLGLAGYGAALASSGVYAWWCRRASLRVSLYASVPLVALSALPYLFYSVYTPYMPRAIAIEGLGTFLQYLAYLPLFDLVVRSTPKGSEALGYSLLISIWNIGLMLGSKTGPWLYEKLLHKDMNSLIWLNAGVTLAGVFLVLLIPKQLIAGREGK